MTDSATALDYDGLNLGWPFTLRGTRTACFRAVRGVRILEEVGKEHNFNIVEQREIDVEWAKIENRQMPRRGGLNFHY